MTGTGRVQSPDDEWPKMSDLSCKHPDHDLGGSTCRNACTSGRAHANPCLHADPCADGTHGCENLPCAMTGERWPCQYADVSAPARTPSM